MALESYNNSVPQQANASQNSAQHVSHLDAALRYAHAGMAVFPLAPRMKEPLIAAANGGRGFRDATVDPDQVRRWWVRAPLANIGIALGPEFSDLVVIDIDPKNGGTYESFVARWGELPRTKAVRSGSGGLHFLFRNPHIEQHEGFKLKRNTNGRFLGEGIDALCEGGYVVAPPSIHPSGVRYEWLDATAPVADLPVWLRHLWVEWSRPAQTPTAPALPVSDGDLLDDGAYWLKRALEQSTAGSGDATGYWLAQQLLVNQVNDSERYLGEYARQATLNPADPFSDRDIGRWLSSAARSDVVRQGEPARRRAHLSLVHLAPRESAPSQSAQRQDSDDDDERPNEGDGTASHRPMATYPDTEMGNAERLFDRHGQDFLYCPAFGFCTWDGQRWQRDGELKLRLWAKETIRAMHNEAEGILDRMKTEDEANPPNPMSESEEDVARRQLRGRAEHLAEWARKSERDHMISAMLSLVRSECVVSASQFDEQPWLLNCRNGTVDLRTGHLRKHRREDYLMQVTPVDYDPDAPCPRFEQFVEEILLRRKPLIDYIQRVLGYTISGDIREQVWHLLLGDGENGKGTLMETLAYTLGDDYAGVMEPESLLASNVARDGAAPSPDIADLKGKRFVRVTEMEEGAKLAVARIKKLSGGDTLKARLLRKEFFSFKPNFKLFIYTNHEPQARETKHAFWRRVRYIPFDYNLRDHPEQKDPDLAAKLQAEASGILAWLVRGCLLWQHEGLNPPKEVLEATERYREEQDVLRPFLTERCYVAADAKAKATPLYELYTAWCKENGMHAMARPRFSSALRERNLERRHTRVGDVWVGIGILDGNYQTTVSTEDMQPPEDEMIVPREGESDVKREGVKDCEGFSIIPHNVSPPSQTLSVIIENPSQDFTTSHTPLLEGKTVHSLEEKINNQQSEKEHHQHVTLPESFVSRRVRELEATGMGSDAAIKQALREKAARDE